MKITVVCVGKLKERYLRDAVAEYEKRLGRYGKLRIIEVADEPARENASPAEYDLVREKEAGRIRRAIPEDAYVIALAIQAPAPDSLAFARKLDHLTVLGQSHICFLIGGSCGMTEELLASADETVSFSNLTFPHQLMRVILLEQIYRAFRIIRGEPYHK